MESYRYATLIPGGALIKKKAISGHVGTLHIPKQGRRRPNLANRSRRFNPLDYRDGVAISNLHTSSITVSRVILSNQPINLVHRMSGSATNTVGESLVWPHGAGFAVLAAEKCADKSGAYTEAPYFERRRRR